MLVRIADWPAYLRSGLRARAREALRHHERTGRPLGLEGFIALLEAWPERRLKKRKPGPAMGGGKAVARTAKSQLCRQG